MKQEQRAKEKEENDKARKKKNADFAKLVKHENNERWANMKIYPKAEPKKDYVKPRDHVDQWYRTEEGIEFGNLKSKNKVDWQLSYTLTFDGEEQRQPTIKFAFSHHKGDGTNLSQVSFSFGYFYLQFNLKMSFII